MSDIPTGFVLRQTSAVSKVVKVNLIVIKYLIIGN